MSKADEIMGRLDSVPNNGKNWVEFLASVIGGDYDIENTGAIEDFETAKSALAEAFSELEARAMPEGCEWPRYEDGEPVRIGDAVTCTHGNTHITSVKFSKNGAWVFTEWYGKDDRLVMRPVDVKRQQILAADGEPLEVGQTVYTLKDDSPYTVKSVKGDRVYVNAGGSSIGVWRFPSKLTHQLPVLDADGLPINAGDTVWCVATDDELAEMKISPNSWSKMREKLTVKSLTNGASGAKWADFEETHLYVKTCYLTHAKPEPPDSWERIEEDCSMFASEYAERFGLEKRSGGWGVPMRRDLVRRCKALAEKEPR